MLGACLYQCPGGTPRACVHSRRVDHFPDRGGLDSGPVPFHRLPCHLEQLGIGGIVRFRGTGPQSRLRDQARGESRVDAELGRDALAGHLPVPCMDLPYPGDTLKVRFRPPG